MYLEVRLKEVHYICSVNGFFFTEKNEKGMVWKAPTVPAAVKLAFERMKKRVQSKPLVFREGEHVRDKSEDLPNVLMLMVFGTWNQRRN